MTDQLNAQRIKQIQAFYSMSPNFRAELDKNLQGEIGKAKTLISQLGKLNLEGASEEKKTVVVNAPKKRGRPLGSVNKGPSKKREPKKEKTESVIETSGDITHRAAIIGALAGQSEALRASQIMEAIVAAKHKGYKAPSKQVLYTSLSSMKANGTLKTQGEKPNSLYLLA
jgi:hypothetical protein